MIRFRYGGRSPRLVLDVSSGHERPVLVDAVLDLLECRQVAVAVVGPLLAIVRALFPEQEHIDVVDLPNGVDLSLLVLATGDELANVQIFEFDYF